jgi:DNA-binding XRE family transcriptional regulator
MNSSNILKGFRGKRLLTQDNMAEKLKISRQMYNIYENDLTHCELDLIMKILSNLDISAEELTEFLNALKQDYLSYSNEEEQGG